MERANPKRNAMLPYGKQHIDNDDIAAVIQVLRSELITQGPAIEKFESKIADYVGAKYAVAFSNGTAALHGACFAAGISPGDEVITTPITFLASSNCVMYVGGTPVFADIKSDTYNIDPEQIEAKISKKTRAIIAVDFTGQPVEIDRINEIAQKNNLIVIQDAAHSLGAEYDGRKVGALADMTMFSFHPVKHITTGEGGVIVTNDEEYYNKLVLFRSHGVTRNPELMRQNDGPWYYEMIDLGYNYRMTDLQAALGISQMDKLVRFVEKRRHIAKNYNDAFRDMSGLIIPFQHSRALSSWHLYVLGWKPEAFKADRKMIFESMRAENIGVHVHYIPIHKQPYYRDLGYGEQSYPNAESYYEISISLPIFPSMDAEDVEHVIQAVKRIYNQYFK